MQQPGQVIASTGKSHYTVGEAITAVVTNGLAASIWTTDHKTSCTIVTVERQVGDTWQTVAPCRSMMATHLIEVQAGSRMPVQVFAGDGGAPPSFPAGVYRIEFAYYPNASLADGTQVTIYSSQFTIG